MRRPLALTFFAGAAVLLASGGSLDIVSPAGRVAVDEASGAVLGVWPKGGGKSVWQSGEYGLWRVRFTNRTEVCAADFATNGCRIARDGRTFVYDHPLVRVSVSFVPTPAGVDLRGEVAAKTALPATDIDLPARLRFAPESVDRFYMPQKGNEGMGFALKAGFFGASPADTPAGWRRASVKGVYGYGRMFGGNVSMRPLGDPEVEVTVTDEGRRFLPQDVVAWIEKKSSRHMVNRACLPGQYDVALVDSPNGPFLSGSRFGGTGALWRVGTTEHLDDPNGRLGFVRGVVRALAKKGAKERPKMAVVELLRSPVSGGMSGASVAAYVDLVKTVAEKRGFAFETLMTPDAIQAALARRDHLVILSPYGEGFPVASPEAYKASLDALKAWVRAGGNWIEVGGASFFHALVPTPYCTYERPYPNLFMDFCELKSADGGLCALFGVRPRPKHEPWKLAPADFFRPGTLGCGGDEKGGYAVHSFRLWTKDGAVERLPAVRFALGLPLQEAVDAYGAANDLGRPLADKIDAAKLEVLKKSLFYKMGGKAAEILPLVPDLPKPTTLHVSQYLKGGFDKQYPDHLPSNPERFGTDAEHRALVDALHAHGHLYSPYTNPTWWCDNPPGPSFVAAGRAPLAVGLDGKNYHEQYSKNDGWSVTYWHPAVQEANRRTVRQFTEDLPVDLLFQDQCGARQFKYDFNPASPTPLAYTEGQLAMNEEDSRVAPLGTEDGWDRAADNQAGLFGVSWYTVPLSLVPRRHSRPLAKSEIPPHLWEFEPLAARLMHTKTLFWMHDLGSFVTSQRVYAWMLALGYNMSYSTLPVHYAKNPRVRGWANWLAATQRAVCSRIAGEPLRFWRHDRSAMLARTGFNPAHGEDDGVVIAQWGEVKCVVNLGDVPRKVAGGVTLAPYGFHITAPGLLATALDGAEPTIVENGKTVRFSDYVDKKWPWHVPASW